MCTLMNLHYAKHSWVKRVTAML